MAKKIKPKLPSLLNSTNKKVPRPAKQKSKSELQEILNRQLPDWLGQ